MKKILILLFVGVVAWGCHQPSSEREPYSKTLGTPPDSEVWYTTNDGTMITTLDEGAFNVGIKEHLYTDGVGVIRFDGALTTIGDEAFYGCNRVDNISLPRSVESIGSMAFYDCNALGCISLGGALRECGENAFEGSFNLTTVHIADLASWCAVKFEGVRSNPIYFASLICLNGKPVKALVIPEGVTSIGEYAFCNLVAINSVSLPASLTSVGRGAFEDCLLLERVDISDANRWCCVEFEDIYSNPLYYGGELYLKGSKFTALKVDSDVVEIGQHAFVNCTSLKTVDLGYCVKRIGDAAFSGCRSIAKANLGSGVRRVGDEAFRNATAMSQVVIGEMVDVIGHRAFMGCYSLQNIYCDATTPPTLADSYTFAYGAEHRRFFVPEEAVQSYKESDMWEQYAADIYPYTY